MLRDFSYQLGDAQYVSWESLFRNVLAKEKTIILDEFQNFLRVDNSVFSILQKVWDEYSGGSLLIFCGSYAGMMKRIFSDSREPLFGRADYLMELKAFAFEDVHEMLSSFGYSLTDIVQWYAMLGGVPHYLSRIQERKHSDVLLEELFLVLLHHSEKKEGTCLSQSLVVSIQDISLFLKLSGPKTGMLQRSLIEPLWKERKL